MSQAQCSRRTQAPVHGQLQQIKLGSRDVWQFNIEEEACSYGLWERPQTASCLQGTWVILMGASQTNIWTTQLANSLVEEALLTKRDHFSIDGVFTQMIDIVIEMDDDGRRGRVVYRNVLRDPRGKPPGRRIKSHTRERDDEVLREAFAQASLGRQEARETGPGLGSYEGELPTFSGKQIRITNFFAEYWDNVEVALDAIEDARLGWRGAEMTLAVSIGLWYINSLHCGPTSAWCATRPELGKLSLEGLVGRYRRDMNATMPRLRAFCSEGGPAGRRGCAITSIDHCQFMQGAIWHMVYDAVKQGMQPIGTPLLRFVDLWTFTLEIPEDCLGGHQSPMSTLWTWQVLLSGICKSGKAARGPAVDFRAASGALAEFQGPMCRAQQVVKFCPNPKAKGFHYQWECALSELCSIRAVEAPESMRPIKVSNVPVRLDLKKASRVSQPSTWASAWRLIAGSLPFRLLLLFVAVAAALLSQQAWERLRGPQRGGAKGGKVQPVEEQKHLLADEQEKKRKPDLEVNKEALPGSVTEDEGSPKGTEPPKSSNAAKQKAAPADRFAFGLARCIASSHVVAGHLYAKSAIADFPAFGWGFTWVPWFFMLSGFILFSAEQRRPNQESCLDYVLRRSVNIYPLYAVGLILAFLIAKSEGTAPSDVVLVLQAWLLQAWFPNYTEGTLNMQCWFLCCLVLYWALFRLLYRLVSGMSARRVVASMLTLYMLPWLVIIVPVLLGKDKLYWYHDHTFGHHDTAVDYAVVFLKFHPFTFTHIFVLGMLLARLRGLIDVNHRLVRNLLEVMAPLGYLGLGLVFCCAAARPPAAKLSARLSVLLPFQSMILLGLAGLPGFQPKVAEWASSLNFLESYSYAVYVNQFICWHVWPERRVGPLFFAFLAAVATVFVHLVQKPADELLRKTSNNKLLLLMPVAVMVVLPLLNHLLPDAELSADLPAVTRIDSRLSDVRLPLRADGNDGSVLINPSLLFRGENEVVFVARRHRRSHHKTRDNCYHGGEEVTCIEEIWHSEIVVGTKLVHWSEWNRWLDVGAIPSMPRLARWTGLRTPNNRGAWTNLCVREVYNSANRTLTRLVVTGPEDPKVFQLGEGGSGPVELAFSSYPPLGRHGCAEGRAVPQMYLASGVDVLHPERLATGNPLRCGVQDRAEKNWIPFRRGGELHFVYSVLPHVVMKVRRDGTCGSKVYSNFGPLTKLQAQLPGLFFSGSAQAVFVNDTEATPQLPRPHYLALFHVKDPRNGTYAHFAYRFNPDPPFQMLQVSAQLPLKAARTEDGGAGIAFASGLGIRDRQVVISYSAGDRESRALVMTLWKLDDMFNPDHVTEDALRPASASGRSRSSSRTVVFAVTFALAGPLFVLLTRAVLSTKASSVIVPAAS